jgi:hypothetical protein
MRMASIKSAAKAFFSATEAFLREEKVLLSVAARGGVTPGFFRNVGVKVARFGVTKCLRHLLLGLGGLNL